MNGSYGHHWGYVGGMYGPQGGFFGQAPYLTSIFSLIVQLLFFLLIISVIAAAVVFLRRTLLGTNLLVPAGGTQVAVSQDRCTRCSSSVKKTFLFCPTCGESLAVTPINTNTANAEPAQISETASAPVKKATAGKSKRVSKSDSN